MRTPYLSGNRQKDGWHGFHWLSLFLLHFVRIASLQRKSFRRRPQNTSRIMRGWYLRKWPQNSTRLSKISSAKPRTKSWWQSFRKCNQTPPSRIIPCGLPRLGERVKRPGTMAQFSSSLFRIEKCSYKSATDWRALCRMRWPNKSSKRKSSRDSKQAILMEV